MRHTPEPIIGKLREAEVALSQGAKVPEACRKPGVTEQTSYLYGLLPHCKRIMR
jgi:hypothetical protein